MILILLLILCLPAGIADLISTYAGNLNGRGDGGPSQAALVTGLGHIFIPAGTQGDIYIAEKNYIRKINRVSGIITTIVGGGSLTLEGLQGTATALDQGSGITGDTAGNIYFTTSCTVRMLTPSGTVTTVAGVDGVCGYTTSTMVGSQLATSLLFNNPNMLFYHTTSNTLIINDASNFVVRLVNMTSHTAGDYIGNGSITTSARDGMSLTKATFGSLAGMWADTALNMYLVDSGDCRVRKGSGSGQRLLSTLAGNGTCAMSSGAGQTIGSPTAICGDTSGNLYFHQQMSNGGKWYKVSSGGGTLTDLAGDPTSTLLASNVSSHLAYFKKGTSCNVHPLTGELYVADTGLGFVWKMDLAKSIITSVVGYVNNVAVPATSVRLKAIYGLWVRSSTSDLYISDYLQHIVHKVSASSRMVSVYAGTGIAGQGANGVAATSSTLNFPQGIVGKALGDLYIVEFGQNRVRMVSSPTGIISTVVGTGIGCLHQNVASGPLGTMTLCNPIAIAYDSYRDVFYISELGSRIRTVNILAGTMTTLLGNGTTGYSPSGPISSVMIGQVNGLAIDNQFNVVYSEYTKHTVRYVDLVSSNSVTTIIGNTSLGRIKENFLGTLSPINYPVGVCVDPSNNIFIVQDLGGFGYRVIKWSGSGITAGLVSTYAGNGVGGFSGEYAEATSTNVYTGKSCYFANGKVYFADADTGNNGRVHVIGNLYPTGQPTSQPSRQPSRQPSSQPSAQPVAYGTQAMVTVAGSLYPNNLGDGLQAPAGALTNPSGVFLDSQGNLFIAEQSRIRRIDGVTKIVSTHAGGGGSNSEGVPATTISISGAQGIAGDTSGNIFYSDAGYHVIRKVSFTAKTVSAVVGALVTAGYSGDGLSGTSARVNTPTGLFYSSASNVLYITDSLNHAIRALNLTTSIITTVVGDGIAGYVDFFVGPQARLNQPSDVWLDSLGNMFIAEKGGCRIRKMDYFTGLVSTILGATVSIQCISTGDGILAINAKAMSPTGVCGDAAGNLFFTQQDNTGPALRMINSTGYTQYLSTLSSGGSPLVISGLSVSSVRISFSYACKVDSAGNLLVADKTNNLIWKIAAPVSKASIITSVVGYVSGVTVPAIGPKFTQITGMWINSLGDLYLVEYNAHVVHKLTAATNTLSVFAGTGYASYSSDRAATLASLCYPFGVTGDNIGNVYISDTNNYRIRGVNSSLIMRTIAGAGCCCSGPYNYNGPAVGAFLCTVYGIAFYNNKVYFYDSKPAVRMITLSVGNLVTVVSDGTAGYIDNVAPLSGRISTYVQQMFVDSTGVMYLVDDNNAAIRKVDFGGSVITTYAGLTAGAIGNNIPATAASLDVEGVCGSADGNIYVTTKGSNNFWINVINPDNGILRRIAGSGPGGPSSEYLIGRGGNTGTLSSCFVDSLGVVYYVETNTAVGYRIRKLTTYLYPTGQPTNQPSRQPSRQPSAQPSIQPHHPTSQPSRQPSSQPIGKPSGQPSRQPSSQPSSQPWSRPTTQPSSQPSRQPSVQPSQQPTGQPTAQPSLQPSRQPTLQPISLPTARPSRQPSSQPSCQPQSRPTGQPSAQPSMQPTMQPSMHPTAQPISRPSSQPSGRPTSQPSQQPSSRPSGLPTTLPSTQPSNHPTCQPTQQPSGQPSSSPSMQPSAQPISFPTSQPTKQPTNEPSVQPSMQPTSKPTGLPTEQPSGFPSSQPTLLPSSTPSAQPSSSPSGAPTSQPSERPTSIPSSLPSVIPSSQPSSMPSRVPSSQPTAAPSSNPSVQPSGVPSSQPLSSPSSSPSTQPSSSPTMVPSGQPTASPSGEPTNQPSGHPTCQPSVQPTCGPTNQPSDNPSRQPSAVPSTQPSNQPSAIPTVQPSCCPSMQPSAQPSERPTVQPSDQPSDQPSVVPSSEPTSLPSMQPYGVPTCQPSITPSGQPSCTPTEQPLAAPTFAPSSQPSGRPSCQPTHSPSVQPSSKPSEQPSVQPTCQPSAQPSAQPSSRPTDQPSLQPSVQPSVQPMSYPTDMPSSIPSCQPQAHPTRQPTMQPSHQPSLSPSKQPIARPSSIPSGHPTTCDTASPTTQPTIQPSGQPVVCPSALPSRRPTGQPSRKPSSQPSFQPSSKPSKQPNSRPSSQPSRQPTWQPTSRPTVIHLPLFIASAIFSNDGLQVEIRFSSPTNRAGFNGVVFPCSRVLHFVSTNAAWYDCVWQDPSTLLASAGRAISNDLKVGSLMQLNTSSHANRLGFACPPAEFAPCPIAIVNSTHAVAVSAPDHPIIPIIGKFASTTISNCASWRFDFSSATGNAGRQWDNVSFVIVGVVLASNTSMIVNEMQRQVAQGSVLVISNALLAQGESYNVTVTLCNFMGSCGSNSMVTSVSATSSSTPVASIIGYASRVIQVNESLLLTSSSYVEVCGSDRTSSALLYAWKIKLLSSDSWLALPSKSKDDRKFVLPAYSLTAEQTYFVQLTVTDSSTSASSSCNVSVQVLTVNLVAAILPTGDQLLRVGSILLLNASSSFDPNTRTPGAAIGSLSFGWSCRTASSVLDSAGAILWLPCRLSMTMIGAQSAAIRLSANQTALRTVSQVQLVVIDPAHPSKGNATSVVTVQVTESAAPVITMLTPAGNVAYVDIGNSLSLLSTISSSSSACNASWRVNDPSINLNNVITSPYPKTIPSNRLTTVNLYLSPFALQGGSSYLFTLSCISNANHAWDSSISISVATNAPPYGGRLTAVPDKGYALNTSFLCLTDLWIDQDLPLMYSFSFLSVVDKGYLPIASKSQASSVYAALPSSPSGNNILVAVISEDIYGADSARVIHNVTVLPLPSSALSAAVSNILAQAGGVNASIDQLQNILSVASNVLNTVDCSHSPNCSMLHRQTCLGTTNTCGPCSAGYLSAGSNGDSNTVCFSTTAVATSTSSSASCSSANAASVCLPWQFCNTSSHKCIELSKPCAASNCSSHGACRFIASSSGLPIATCALLSSSCDAVCICQAGYAGAGCSMSSAELAAEQAVRAQLLDGLSTIIANTDPDTTSLTNAASSLAAIIRNQYDFNAASSAQVARITQAIISQSSSLSTNDALQVAAVLSPVDAALTTASNNSRSNFSQAVSIFQTILSNPQQPVSAVFDTFRVVSNVFPIPSGNNTPIVIPIPLTDAERALQAAGKLAVPTVSLLPGTTGNGSSGSVSVSVMVIDQKAVKTNTTHLDSDVVAVQANNVKYVDISLSPKNPPPVVRPINFTLTCPPRIKMKKNFTCTDSGYIEYLQCNGTAGSFFGFCPVLMESCSVVSLVGQTMTSGAICSAVNSSSSATITCRCTMGAGTTAGIVAAGLVLNYVGSDLSHTFQASSAFNDASAVKKAFIVIVLYSGLWGCSVLTILYLIGWQWTGGADKQRKNKDKHQSTKELLNDSKSLGKLALIHPHTEEKEKETLAASRKKLAAYISSIFPAVFAAKTVLAGLKNEIMVHHEYVSFFFRLTHRRSPILSVVQMMTMQSFTLFLLALLYDLNYPDDDRSCPQFTSIDRCLNRKYILDNSRSYCKWTAEETDAGVASCSYADPSFSFTIAMYVSMMISLATCLVSEPLEYMITVLSSPSVSSLENPVVAVKPTATAASTPVSASNAGLVIRGAEPIAAASGGRPSASLVRTITIRDIPNVALAAHDDVCQFSQQIAAEAMPTLQRRDSQRLQLAKAVATRLGEASALLSAGSSFSRLQQNIILQRELLTPEQRDQFDIKWGLDATGHFIEKEVHHWRSGRTVVYVNNLVKDELADVKQLSEDFTDDLAVKNDAQKGFEILQLFVMDILGRNSPAARIFAAKTDLDFEKLETASMKAKVAMAVFIILLNGLFVFYTIIKGYTKGLPWQWDFVKAWAAQLFLEIFLFETLQCIWIHFAMPYLVASEVNRAYILLQQTVDHLFDHSLRGNQVICLNAPDFFFVSHRLAYVYPDLVESSIVRAYSSHLPGEVAKVWVAEIKKLDEESKVQERSLWDCLLSWLPRIFIISFLVQVAAYAPLQLQRFVIRVMEPLILSGLTFGLLFVMKNPIYLAGLCGALAILVAALLWDYYRVRKEIDVDVALNAGSNGFASIAPDQAVVDVEQRSRPTSPPLHKPAKHQTVKRVPLKVKRIQPATGHSSGARMQKKSSEGDDDESSYLESNSLDIASSDSSHSSDYDYESSDESLLMNKSTKLLARAGTKKASRASSRTSSSGSESSGSSWSSSDP